MAASQLKCVDARAMRCTKLHTLTHTLRTWCGSVVIPVALHEGQGLLRMSDCNTAYRMAILEAYVQERVKTNHRQVKQLNKWYHLI